MQRFLTALMIAAFLIPTLTFGAAKKTKKDEKDKKPKAYTKVDSVNAGDNKITITDTDGKTKEYTVDAFTVIIVDGKPGKLSDASKDMAADITISGGGTKLSRVEFSEPPAPKPDKKKKKN